MFAYDEMITQEQKIKFEKDFVIIYKGRYWGINFKEKQIKEITFDEGFGNDFFDWDKNICLASGWCKEQYKDGYEWIGKIVAMACEVLK